MPLVGARIRTRKALIAGLEMTRQRELKSRIKKLREEKLNLNQLQFASKIGTAASRVSEWESGKTKPRTEALYRLGSLASNIEDTIWFWRQAGLDEKKIVDAARKIGADWQEAKTVPIPQYRYTKQGRQEAGPPIPLPKEFIPNVASTICLAIDDQSTGVIDAPRGTFVVDTSVQDTQSPSEFYGKVIVFSFSPLQSWDRHPVGIYIGRLWLQGGARKLPGSVELTHYWSLILLTGGAVVHRLDLGSPRTIIPFDVPSERKPEAFTVVDVLEFIKQREEERGLWEKTVQDLQASFRFANEHCVLGQVIGRLSGKVK